MKNSMRIFGIISSVFVFATMTTSSLVHLAYPNDLGGQLNATTIFPVIVLAFKLMFLATLTGYANIYRRKTDLVVLLLVITLTLILLTILSLDLGGIVAHEDSASKRILITTLTFIMGLMYLTYGVITLVEKNKPLGYPNLSMFFIVQFSVFLLSFTGKILYETIDTPQIAQIAHLARLLDPIPYILGAIAFYKVMPIDPATNP